MRPPGTIAGPSLRLLAAEAGATSGGGSNHDHSAGALAGSSGEESGSCTVESSAYRPWGVTLALVSVCIVLGSVMTASRAILRV